MAQRAKSKGEKASDETMEKASKIASDTEKAVEASRTPVRLEPVDLPTGERSHPPA